MGRPLSKALEIAGVDVRGKHRVADPVESDIGHGDLMQNVDAVQIRLPRRTVDMVDRHVRTDLEMQAATMAELGHSTEAIGPRQVGHARRKFLTDLIEKTLGFEAQHPIEFDIRVPRAGFPQELWEVDKWCERAKEELWKTAPASVHRAIKINRLFREEANLDKDRPLMGRTYLRGPR